MNRLRAGELTGDDIDVINEKFVSDESILPTPSSDVDVCYACAFNKERNAIHTGIFKKLIEKNPLASSDDENVPGHVVAIEAAFRKGKVRLTRATHNEICQKCGDAQVKTSRNTLYDPCLVFYCGVPLMINSNADIEKGLGNGTLCRGLKLVLKEGRVPRWKNWDGRKVLTVSIDDCDHLLCEHWPRKPDESPRYFHLKEANDTVTNK